ncbi:hypothetical protein MMC22_001514 [Lobaria immixta]|nr:hypothetical protein [Lobaria immixta]
MDASPLLTLPPEILFLIIKQPAPLSTATEWRNSSGIDPMLEHGQTDVAIRDPCQEVHCSIGGTRKHGRTRPATQHQQRDEFAFATDAQSRELSIEGLFYTSTLREVVRIQNLHTLELRTSERYMCLNVDESVSGSVSDYYQKSQHLGFRNMVVDFTLLGQLQSLRKLVVGRLVKRETTTLARAISLLSRLEHLEVEAPHWSYRWGHLPKPHPEELDFSSTDPSPVPDFLKDLHMCPVGQFSLPESLKVFIIRDKHHIFGDMEYIDERSFQQILRPCLNLHTLVVDIKCTDSSAACDDAVEALALPALRKVLFPCLKRYSVWSHRFSWA